MRPVTGIVVNYNGGERTLRCIDALKAQTVPFEKILVVDNASSDGSVDALKKRHPEVTILQQSENLGLSKARNIGIRHARTPLLLSIDSDMYMRPDALERLLDGGIKTAAAVLCPRVLLYPDCVEVQCEGAEVHFTGTFLLRNAGSTDLASVPEPVTTSGAPGGCLLLDRSAVMEAGGFNELFFFYHEDIEFSLRMRALGHDIVTVAAAVVDHDRGEGTPGLSFRGSGDYPARRARLSIRNRLILLLIHYETRTLIVLSPVLFVYELGTFGFAVMRGWLREYGGALGEIARLRKKIAGYRNVQQRRRLRGDRQLLVASRLAFGSGVMRSRVERQASRIVIRAMSLYWRMARTLLRE